jgi:hypothetical protein
MPLGERVFLWLVLGVFGLVFFCMAFLKPEVPASMLVLISGGIMGAAGFGVAMVCIFFQKTRKQSS